MGNRYWAVLGTGGRGGCGNTAGAVPGGFPVHPAPVCRPLTACSEWPGQRKALTVANGARRRSSKGDMLTEGRTASRVCLGAEHGPAVRLLWPLGGHSGRSPSLLPTGWGLATPWKPQGIAWAGWTGIHSEVVQEPPPWRGKLSLSCPVPCSPFVGRG